eukprot:c21434_g2_i1 orf=683-1408(-)
MGTRSDGRTSNHLRPLTCSRGLLHRADGSARWSHDNTIVVAAVYGPKAVSGRRENAERAILEVTWKPKSGIAANAEKESELILRRSLEYIMIASLHPNTAISVIIQVINDDGAVVPCALNAACAALVDAGIPLRNLLAAISCGVTKTGDILLDPTKREEQQLSAHVCFVFPCRPTLATPGTLKSIDGEPLEHAIITSLTKGAMSVDDYLNCLERGRAASYKITEFARTSLERAQRIVETTS